MVVITCWKVKYIVVGESKCIYVHGQVPKQNKFSADVTIAVGVAFTGIQHGERECI